MLEADVGLMIWTIISFVLLLGVMMKFGYKPITTLLKKREETIKKLLDEAEAKMISAENLHKEAESDFQKSRMKSKEILESAEEEAKKIKNDIINKAEKEADSIVTKAKMEAEIQRQRALVDVQSLVIELGISSAEKLIKTKLDSENNKATIKQFVGDITTAKAVKELFEKSETAISELGTKTGEQVVEIVTAFPITDEISKGILEELSKITGRKWEKSKNIVEKDILGGAIIRIEDKVIDGSVKKKIEELQKRLKL